MSVSVQGALFDPAGPSMEAAASVPSVAPSESETSPEGQPVTSGSARKSRRHTTATAASDGHAGCVTARSGGSALPPSRRKPGAEEREFLRLHRLVYHRPELFPNETLELSREALRLGYRHPRTSMFAWPEQPTRTAHPSEKE